MKKIDFLKTFFYILNLRKTITHIEYIGKRDKLKMDTKTFLPRRMSHLYVDVERTIEKQAEIIAKVLCELNIIFFSKSK